MTKDLKNPIKEIILSVSFDKKLEIERLKEFCEDEIISKEFPSFSPGFDAKLNLGEKPSSEFDHTSYVLKSEGELRNILNLKLGKISYHTIDRYETFDLLIDKLDEYWQTLQRIFGDLPITAINARYINKIQVHGGERYEDYIKVAINTPFDKIQGQFINFNLNPIKREDGDIKSTVIIVNGKDKSLILDIIVEKSLHKIKMKNISDAFIELRPIKNNIFQHLVTEKTQQKFDLL